MKLRGVVRAGVAVVLLTIACASTVMASSRGQLAGGSVYKVRDVTTHGKYATSIAAAKCDKLQFGILLLNTEFGRLSNLVVKASLPSRASTHIRSAMVTTTAAGGTTGTTGVARIALKRALRLSYVPGSTKLYNGKAKLVKTLPDGITRQGGIGIGSLSGGATEFVTFVTRLSCS